MKKLFLTIISTFILFVLPSFSAPTNTYAAYCGTGSWSCCINTFYTCTDSGGNSCVSGEAGCICTGNCAYLSFGDCSLGCLVGCNGAGVTGTSTCTGAPPPVGGPGGGSSTTGTYGTPPTYGYPTPYAYPTPADIKSTALDLTDSAGVVHTNFSVGDRIYVKNTITNSGGLAGNTPNGRMYTTFYKDHQSLINIYNVPSDPRNFYLDTGVFPPGQTITYNSWPGGLHENQFPGLNYWTMSSAGTYYARVFADYDGRVNEDYNFNNNQATQQYTVKATISGKAFFDTNEDNGFDTGEPGIGNVTVDLWKKSATGAYTTHVLTDHTDSGGMYNFPNRTEGDYMIQITKPTNYVIETTNPRYTTLGGNKTLNFAMRKYHATGRVYFDKDQNGSYSSTIDTGYQGATVTIAGPTNATLTSAADGTFTIKTLTTGDYTATVTLPTDYKNTTPTAITFTIPPDKSSLNFGIFPKYTVSGNVFIDENGNGKKNGSEVNYPAKPSIKLDNTTNYVTANSNGTYTIAGLTSGTYTVSYDKIPAGYFPSYPLNGPPQQYSVKTGTLCPTLPTTPGSPVGGVCDASKNVTDLDFGISPGKPWTQTYGLDVRLDNGIQNPIPNPGSIDATCGNGFGNSYMSVKTSAGTTPGILFSGDASASFGQGSASETNWLVGGTVYPELFSPVSAGVTRTSYDYLFTTARQSGVSPKQILNSPSGTVPGGCSSYAACTLTTTLANGVYTTDDGNSSTNDSMTLNGFTIGANTNKNYVILVNGDLTIKGDVTVSNTAGSTVVFSVKGNINIDPSVGATPVCPAPAGQLQGFFSTDNSFIIQTTNNTATEKMFNMEGALVINATYGTGTLQNKRDIGNANNVKFPTFTVKERPDMLLNLPSFVKSQNYIWQEVAP